MREAEMVEVECYRGTAAVEHHVEAALAELHREHAVLPELVRDPATAIELMAAAP
jgi:hypothetical protein